MISNYWEVCRNAVSNNVHVNEVYYIRYMLSLHKKWISHSETASYVNIYWDY